MPKLRDLAKAETELQGVGGMEKEELVKAIAKAKNIPYEVSAKDANAIHSIKHDIRERKRLEHHRRDCQAGVRGQRGGCRVTGLCDERRSVGGPRQVALFADPQGGVFGIYKHEH